ncbi:MAG: hypothetical protein U5L96_16970 [Owenweeksia sp.]|nr:hypothetical protein [Owenweeksia sp.]
MAKKTSLKYSLLIALIFITALASAQFNGEYLRFRLGYSHQRLMDQSLSPVSYSGHMAL